MNNYSAKASTEETIKFLEEVLNKSKKYIDEAETIQQDILNDAKDYVSDIASDDDQLYKILEDNNLLGTHTYYSNYSTWERLSWFGKFFDAEPTDDRKAKQLKGEQLQVTDAQAIINNTLDDIKTLKNFYRIVDDIFRTNITMRFSVGDNFPVGYELMVDIIRKKIPDTLRLDYNKLEALTSNVKRIKRMYESLIVYEFDSVTIEEDMLSVIKFVQEELDN